MNEQQTNDDCACEGASSRCRRWLGRLALLTVALLLLLCSAEIAFRILGWRPLTDVEFDPVFGRRFVPGKVGVTTIESFVVSRINSHGFRDREYSFEKPPGVFRIVVLGDSFVEALQVPLEKSFHKLLEARLNAAAGARRFEVISFGMSGNGTGQELLYYRHWALRFKPDLTLVGIYWQNDIVDNSKELCALIGNWMERPFFEWRDGRLVLDNSHIELQHRLEAERADRRTTLLHRLWTKWVRRYSYFLDFMFMQAWYARNVWQEWWGGINNEPAFRRFYDVCLPETPPEWQWAWDLTEHILAQLRDECTETHSPLAVFEVTLAAQLYDDYRNRLYKSCPELRRYDWEKPGRLLQAMMDRLRVPYLPMSAAFKADFRQTGQYAHGHVLGPVGHWNEHGHDLAARQIERFLRENNLISKPTQP
ncbi:MAG: SGNH/GDSL hydrolase family protein [Verrucomicrobia bacterium]|nr:SGNH/GDSL hydrolase family protein [Verrucomicrobiota bacterium]